MEIPKITYTYEMHDIRKRVSTKKELLDKLRPISVSVLHRLKDDFKVEWTYNSNSIEGNTLTAAETKMILENGITVGGKTLREHFEVINHDRAITYLEELVDSREEFRTVDLLSLHRLVLSNIMDDFAGRYRPGMVRIVGANFTPPNARRVPDLL